MALLKFDKNIILGLTFCLFSCLPYFILGQNAYITIHDFLDVTVAHIVNIVDNGEFFNLGSLIPLFDGVERYSIAFSSPFEIKALLFLFLQPYWAVVANILLIKIVAFIGMYLLLKEYLIKGDVIVGFSISLIFSLISFYTDYGISSSGIPVLLYAFLNLYNKKYVIISFFIVALYGFYSVLAMSGFFVCLILGLSILYLWYKNKEINICLLFSLLLLISIYLLINWSIIKGFIFPSEFVSHRSTWHNSKSFLYLSRYAIKNLMIAHYHAGAFIAFPIVCTFIMVWAFFRKDDSELDCYLLSFFLLSVLIICGTYCKLIPIKPFVSFQLDRFYFIYPALIFVCFAKSCSVLMKRKGSIHVIVLIILSLICVFPKNTESIINCKKLLFDQSDVPSFYQFYDKPLFRQISEELGDHQDYKTRVVSIGLYPSVAEYNGYWCLDSYYNSYSLSYKNKFRKVIEKELGKEPELKKKFDNWGNRCYVFSADLYKRKKNYLCGKDDNLPIDNLEINTKALKDLGCEYIFSAVEIINYRKLNLKFINSYTTDKSYWRIFVYQV